MIRILQKIDRTITAEGPVLRGGNGNGDIAPHQIVDGGLGRRFLEAA